MSIAFKIVWTLLTLATGITLIFTAAAFFDANFWVSFSIGFIGAAIVIVLVERLWSTR